MNVLAVIPARKGSRGVPGKNVRDLLGKPVISYTIEAALRAKRIDRIALTTDDPQAKVIGQSYGIEMIDRPAELAEDTAKVDDAMRHCCLHIQQQDGFQPDAVVLLYANVPVRADGIIDQAIEKLSQSGADSVQTLAPVGKFHPYWLYKLEGDRALKYIENDIYQRQNLPPLYMIDGAVGVVRYCALMAARGAPNPHAFWGQDCRGLVQEANETIDIDNIRDFYMAQAVLQEKITLEKTGIES